MAQLDSDAIFEADWGNTEGAPQRKQDSRTGEFAPQPVRQRSIMFGLKRGRGVEHMQKRKSMRSGVLVTVLAVLLVSGVGCARAVRIDVTSQSTSSLYDMGDSQATVNRHVTADPADNSFGLHMSMAASAYLAQGDYDNAYRTLRIAYDLMNGFITDAGGEPHFYKPETDKTWIGDPIEMALNSWYMAVLNYRRGDYSNCIAACKNAELADQPLKWEELSEEDTKNNVIPKEKYVDDMGMVYLLQARAMLRAGSWTQAEIDSTVKAGKDAFLRTPLFDPATAQAQVDRLFADALDPKKNVILVVDLGLCPKHQWAGEHNERVRIAPVQYYDTNAKVLLNGSQVVTDRVCDVGYQKIHRGGREFDETLNGRAVFKETAMEGGKMGVGVGAALMTSNNATARGVGAGIALIGLAFMVMSATTHPEADLRQWESLPGQVNMAFVEMKPGAYAAECEALGLDMKSLPVPRTQRQEFTIPAKGDAIVYLRPLPTCGNPTPPLEVAPGTSNEDTDRVKNANDGGEAALAKETERVKSGQTGTGTGTGGGTKDSGWGAKTQEPLAPAPSKPEPTAPASQNNTSGWGAK